MNRHVHLFLVCLGCLLTLPACPPAPPEDLDDFIAYQMERGHIPGLAAAVVRDGEIVWAQGYGWADIEAQRPATADTLFMLASISKTVTATALMQLWEDGLFKLDDDINPYLPFDVRNPTFPDTPITFRMLLTHTSSIRDNAMVLDSVYTEGDSAAPLGEFLEDYLAPGGDHYLPGRNFYRYPPGDRFAYCNMGVALVGFLVETISGMPFDQYCNQNIFDPLGMDNTRWFLRDLELENIARPYRYRYVTGEYEPYAHYGYPDYPDGQLRTSVIEFARFVGIFTQDGTWNGVRILAPGTVREMLRFQDDDTAPGQGLVWYDIERCDRTALSHSGGDDGVTTQVFFYLNGTAVLLLTNGESRQVSAQAFVDIEERLLSQFAPDAFSDCGV